MAHTEHIIHIHPLAPTKVPAGALCNGCGLCCLFEPCPLGTVLSRRRTGACSAVRWEDSSGRYRCGALVASDDVLLRCLPQGMRWLAPMLAPVLRRWALRWIAAGVGCDSDLEVLPGGPDLATASRSETDSTTMPSSGFSTESRARVRNPHHD